MTVSTKTNHWIDFVIKYGFIMLYIILYVIMSNSSKAGVSVNGTVGREIA